MASMTITEALAEIKTVNKRLEAKRNFVLQYLARQEGLKDPLAKSGGSIEAIREARQSIRDLEIRIIRIRRAISRANGSTYLALGEAEMTIADWLVWRREVAVERGAFLRRVQQSVGDLRDQAVKKGWNVVSDSGEPKADTDLIVNIDERELAEEIEFTEQTLGALDGQLSLKNATVMVEIED